MTNFEIARDIAAQFRRRANTAQHEDEKHGLLAMADSWQQTAELHQVLQKLEPNHSRRTA